MTALTDLANTFRTASVWPTALTLAALTLAAVACGPGQPSERGQAREPTPDTVAPTTTVTTTATTTSTTVVATAPTRPASPVVTASRPTGSRDEIVAVAGVDVHLRCAGVGDTTVLLVAGFGDGAGSWSAVEPTLAARTRVCAYDRPGTGTSAPPVAAQTFATQAELLQGVLTASGEVGPYIVAGHSFGGGAAVSFAAKHPGEVRGVVLVDASPTGWPTTLCAIADDGTGAATFIRGMCDAWADPISNPERLDVFAAFAELDDITSLAGMPVTVVTADHRELPADISDAERSRLDDVWAGGQEHWAALGATPRLITVTGTGHYVQLDEPAVVVDEITRLLP